MTPSVILMTLVFKPAAIATLGGFAVSALSSVGLTVAIKRRQKARRTPAAAAPARIQVQRIQRATNSELPDDVQRRLRMLTADLDRSLSDVASAPPVAPAAPSLAATAPLAEDRTQYFGSEEDLGLSERDATSRFEDSTVRFSAPGLDASEDATRFFDDGGAVDPAEFFGEDIVPLESGPRQAHDSTRFFTIDKALPPAATSAPKPDAAGMQFFGQSDLEVPGTRLFDQSELEAESELEVLSDVEAPVEPQAEPDLTATAPEGATGLLHALPPLLVGEAPINKLDALNAPEPSGDDADASSGTSALQALPVALGNVDAETIGRVKASLAAAATPEIVALTVLDGSGRVLAGETDDDLTGELRSLIAEAGMGSAADIDQPVRLGDDSMGAILLLPTGVNALLGALVLDSGDPAATRTGLRRLARQVGDQMRRAS